MKLYFSGVGNANKSLFKRVASYALEVLGQPEDVELCVSVISKADMRELNLGQRGIDAPTDVLSFPVLDIRGGCKIDKSAHTFDINPKTGCVMLGDIVVCKEITNEQAIEFGHTSEREYAFLFLHGLLHLLGYDHEVGTEMEELQESILNGLLITRTEK